MEPFIAKTLPLAESDLEPSVYIEELIDAVAQLEVYKAKLDSSKLDRSWFLPTLQQKEALASSMLEGTQATLDGVLVDQVNPDNSNKNLSEVRNYLSASIMGYNHLANSDFSCDFIKKIHQTLMSGNIRRNKSTIPGEFRTVQNYIGRGKTIAYIPPEPGLVPKLMENLISYINNPQDNQRPLVRAAIIHAQFETIHPFMDGNGRVGRILVPLFLCKSHQISSPFFFISEALERDQFKYYDLLTRTRIENDWSSWIKFFLRTVADQCSKYIHIVDRINKQYEEDLNRVCSLIHSPKARILVNMLYKYPIINTAILTEGTDFSAATATRYLNTLVDHHILYSDSKLRYRTYFHYDLINIIRE